jgi:hypothetical protein
MEVAFFESVSREVNIELTLMLVAATSNVTSDPFDALVASESFRVAASLVHVKGRHGNMWCEGKGSNYQMSHT